MSSRDCRLVASPQARQDIASILRYTGRTWGRNQLLLYRDKLDEAMRTIVRNPDLGQARPELPETHRIYFVGSHAVVYRKQALIPRTCEAKVTRRPLPAIRFNTLFLGPL